MPPAKHAVSKTSPDVDPPFAFSPQDIELAKLLLDPNNYRFLDKKKFKKRVITRAHEDSVQSATLDSLELSYQLDELKQSIIVNGYVPMERIIVVPYPAKIGFFLIVEGNRRVASLKSLLKEEKDGVRELTSAQRANFSKIPCAVLKASGKSLKHAERVLMGIRHIAGPKEWGAYQQALLVSELRLEDGLDFRMIGETLGMSSSEASRRFRAICALKQMETDELYAKKAEPEFYRLFHELVALPDVRERFGWSAEANAFADLERARQFFELITPDGKREPKLKTYSDIRKLKAIIGHPLAEASLLDLEVPLGEALRISDQGNRPTSASALLAEAHRVLAGVGVMQTPTLTAKDLTVIDDIVSVLQLLRGAAAAVARQKKK